MKHVKFGVFCLGLAIAVGFAVSSLSAQSTPLTEGQVWVQGQPAGRADVMMFAGGGAQLGVRVSDLDPAATTGGVKIDDVNADSPADKAGIKAGDVVVEFDGERVRSARQFTRLVQETPEGRTVAIELLRDGSRQTVNATPEAGRMTWNFKREPGAGNREPFDQAGPGSGERERRFAIPVPPELHFDFDDRMPRRFEFRAPDGFAMPAPAFPRSSSRGRLGVSIQSLTPDLEEYFGATNGGALVSSVRPDSAASKAGVKAGDVIVSINGRSVRDSDDLVRELEDIDGDATIVVLRDKKEVTLKAALEK
jgi:serine protease Do